jgi:hypothetical protein
MLMALCATPHCTQQAVLQIPSIGNDVCLVHAIAFWTGLLAYSKDRPACETLHPAPCACSYCNRLSTSARAVADAELAVTS